MDNVTQKACSAHSEQINRGVYRYLWRLHWERYELLRNACNAKDSRLDGLTWSSSLVQCHIGHWTTNNELVGINRVEIMARSKVLRKAGYSGNLVLCGNILCPLCGPKIMSGRCEEIKRAVHRHLHRGAPSALWMLTFTVRHSKSDTLLALRDSLTNALEAFHRECTVRGILRTSGVVGRVRSLECQYGRANGYHPHSHNLYFASTVLSSDDVDKLKKSWVRCCRRCGIDTSYDIGLDYRECDQNASDYLTKIAAEITLGNTNKIAGAKGDHYNPMQLLQLAAAGNRWAGEVYLDEVLSFRRIRFTHWSRGLKALYGIDDVSDDELAHRVVPNSVMVANIGLETFWSSSAEQRGRILDIVAASGLDCRELRKIGYDVEMPDKPLALPLLKHHLMSGDEVGACELVDTTSPPDISPDEIMDLPYDSDIVPYPITPLGQTSVIPRNLD